MIWRVAPRSVLPGDREFHGRRGEIDRRKGEPEHPTAESERGRGDGQEQ